MNIFKGRRKLGTSLIIGSMMAVVAVQVVFQQSILDVVYFGVLFYFFIRFLCLKTD